MYRLHALGLALQFLTSLPLPKNLPYSPKTLGWSVVFYPWVGLFIGGILWLVQTTLAQQGASLSAALLLATWVMLTGGLHLDGLADSADAWVGGHGDSEKSLKIMKDPAAGPIAVISLVLVLLLKYSALTQAASFSTKLGWIPLLGRLCLPLLLLSTPYVRANGLGSPLVENLPKLPTICSSLLALACAVYFLGLVPVFIGCVSLLLMRQVLIQWLGGCTGDTLGAAVEILETVTLIAVSLQS